MPLRIAHSAYIIQNYWSVYYNHHHHHIRGRRNAGHERPKTTLRRITFVSIRINDVIEWNEQRRIRWLTKNWKIYFMWLNIPSVAEHTQRDPHSILCTAHNFSVYCSCSLISEREKRDDETKNNPPTVLLSWCFFMRVIFCCLGTSYLYAKKKSYSFWHRLLIDVCNT